MCHKPAKSANENNLAGAASAKAENHKQTHCGSSCKQKTMALVGYFACSSLQAAVCSTFIVIILSQFELCLPPMFADK